MTNPTSININDRFITKKGYTFTVMRKSERNNYWYVKFDGERAHEFETHSAQIVSGYLVDVEHSNIRGEYNKSAASCNKISVLGIGYFGVGPYKGNTVVDGKQTKTKEYESWRGMIKRCYCPKTQVRQPSYIGCSVHADWHNFQTFAKWYTEQPGYVEGWDLDKDLLVEGNKVYGPDTCVLLPRQINSLVTMVDFVGDRFLPRGVYIRDGGKFRVELGSLATKRSTVTVKTIEEAFELRNQNTIERIDEIVDVYGDNLPEHVMSTVKKRLHKLLWIPVEEDNAST